jgi:Zn-dependent M28 family amino/carboxypeptidase
VALDPYPQTRCGATVTRHNVIAWLPGRTHPERLILVGGHYDSRSTDPVNGTVPAPGANDSGSQTALVLEAARILGARQFPATLVFVAFAGEEQGLIGSTALARNIENYVPGSRLEAVLVSDIVGGDASANDAVALRQFRLYSPGAPREIAGPDGCTDNTSPSRGLMRFIGTWAPKYEPEMTMLPRLREDRPSRGSDHKPFIARGIPGVRFIETAENLSHQHAPDDTLANMTPAYAERVARVVIASAAALARAPAAPIHFTATAQPGGSLILKWDFAVPGAVQAVVAARPVAENFYRKRVPLPPSPGNIHSVRVSDLGIAPGEAFFVSVGAVDDEGHESLFSYPELRCNADSCAVPDGALDPGAVRN